MSEGLRPHSRRRLALGQNFLTDDRVVRSFVDSLDIVPGELVVDFGAGHGALTMPLIEQGARVIAVEVDPRAVDRLWRRRGSLAAATARRLEIVACPLERFRLPATPYRVVANPPFNRSTELLRRLLDDPRSAPERADLVLQREVVRKRTAVPPNTLLTAAWAPWWIFEHGVTIRRSAFTPQPAVAAAVLHVTRRDPPLLPLWLAPNFADVIRPRWEGTGRGAGRRAGE